MLMPKRQKPSHNRFFRLGAIVGVRGLKGTLAIYSDCRPPEDIFQYDSWWVGPSIDKLQQFHLIRGWTHGKRLLADLQGVDDINAAELLKDQSIWMPDSAVTPLAEGEIFWEDITGCDVFDTETDKLVGTVTALQGFGAQDILCVQTPEDAEPTGEWMLPFVKDVVTQVDIENRRIDVRLLPGMESCFTPKS